MRKTKMNWAILSVTLVTLAISGSARANPTFTAPAVASQAIRQLVLQNLDITTIDLIDWKIGDSTTYDVELAGNGRLGTLLKMATKEEGAAIWVKNQADLMGRRDVTETLINRADGKILKMIHNGQEAQIPDNKVEIISRETTQITVPAGTFSCVHIIAKSRQTSKLEIWTNPTAISLDGNLQMIVGTQFGDMTLKLTGFRKN